MMKDTKESKKRENEIPVVDAGSKVSVSEINDNNSIQTANSEKKENKIYKLGKSNKEKNGEVSSDRIYKEHIKITKKARIFLYAICLIALVVNTVLLFINTKSYTETEDAIINSYDIVTDASYRVHLLENNVFTEEYLPEGRVYPSAITDFISIDFKSELSLTSVANLSGEYIVEAVLQGYQASSVDEKSVIYEKKNTLAEGKLDGNITSTAKINESLNIDRISYRSYAQEIESVLGGETGKDFFIRFSGKYIVDGEEKPFSYVVNIPVTNDKFYEVVKDELSIDSGDMTEQSTIQVVPSFVNYGVYVILLIIAFAIIVSVKFFTENMNDRELEQKKLAGIMKKYGSRMVCIEDIPDTKVRPVLKVRNVVDLFGLADETREPVFYVADEKKLPKSGKMYIFAKEYIYIYEHRYTS